LVTKILIADDHVAFREGMRNILEKEKDFRVVGEASDGEEAVALNNELAPDIILMDIVMPKLSGTDATMRIKQAHPAANIIILSAYSDINYVVGLLEAGACGYLLKSARGNEIVGAIRAVQSGESVLDPLVTNKLLRRVASNGQKSCINITKEDLGSGEIEILKMAARGMSNQEIADALHLSIRTVKAHMTNIFHKMKVGNRTDAIARALREGLVTIDDIQLEKEKDYDRETSTG